MPFEGGHGMSPLEDYLRRMRAGPECQSARWTAAAAGFRAVDFVPSPQRIRPDSPDGG